MTIVYEFIPEGALILTLFLILIIVLLQKKDAPSEIISLRYGIQIHCLYL
jgi:hypothetical protein